MRNSKLTWGGGTINTVLTLGQLSRYKWRSVYLKPVQEGEPSSQYAECSIFWDTELTLYPLTPNTHINRVLIGRQSDKTQEVQWQVSLTNTEQPTWVPRAVPGPSEVVFAFCSQLAARPRPPYRRLVVSLRFLPFSPPSFSLFPSLFLFL